MIKISYKHKKADNFLSYCPLKKNWKTKKIINGNPDLPERLNLLFLVKYRVCLIPFHG